ncbi:MAG: hypothetical protein ACK413_03255 [Patescibacteria group bacterium]
MKIQINQKGIALIVIILIIVGVLIIVGGAYYFARQKSTEIKQPVSIPAPEEKPLEPIDCGTSIDCFISASETCSPAKTVYTVTVDIFGVKLTTTLFLELKGEETGKCVFYLRTEKIDLAFPSNVPQEVVNQQKAIYKKLEGRDGTCKFNTSDLTAMLKRWKEGTFESGNVSCQLTPEGNVNVCKTEGGDFGAAECQGTYFEQPTLEEIYGKRIPANTSVEIEQCPEEAETWPVQEDGTACFENQIDLGSIKGIIVNGKPVQCCLPK